MLRYIINNNIRAFRSAIDLRAQLKSNKIELTLNGGFGDIVLDSQFLMTLRKENPEAEITIYYRDDESTADPSNFSWGKTRHYSSSEGEKNNPISEWLKALNCVDEFIGCNIDQSERGIRVYPESFHKIFGGYWTPRQFNENVNSRVFGAHQTRKNKILLQFIHDIYDNETPIVALHLRRNSPKIIELARLIQKKVPKVKFLLLGSSEHQTLPDTSDLLHKISLIDSYSKGLDTLDLLSLTRKVDLFIGGRGGFELFHWLAEVPSVCFFDEMGMKEVKQLWWHRSLWENNRINQLYQTDSNISEIWEHISRESILK
ncbi:hypothetical protein GNP44_05035 [Aliivibrio fischeri]|uniref:hypothetical protein n=1 Tax=Aliivibrio fischeri TaxID=668 RepID=UPI0012D8B066|nr:hypothetical protein [Aliivibrio fischeri]MUK29467.1 hypothetical protein [Aliivibrio fischeri]